MRLSKIVATAAVAAVVSTSAVNADEVRLSDEQLDQVAAGVVALPIDRALGLALVSVGNALGTLRGIGLPIGGLPGWNWNIAR